MEESQINKPVNVIKVILIEDVPQDVLLLRMLLADIKMARFEIEVADTVGKALERIKEGHFHIALLNLTVEGKKGLSALIAMQIKTPSLPVVILTALEDQSLAIEAVKNGAQDYLVKGKLDSHLLFRVIRYTIERHRVMEEMRRKNIELERLNSLKSEFVSTVSHELRTPLTVILSATHNILQGAFGSLNEAQQKWVNKIKSHSMRLQEMINDILDLSKLQSGHVELRRSAIDVDNFLKGRIENLKLLTKVKNISLSYQKLTELPSVWGDSSRLDQVLTNLVTNAIKFTPEGGRIEVSAENKEKEIQVAVADNGVGISPDHQEAIFDRFTQIRSQDKGHSATQGIGLGLAICKEIISHHRGQIWVESELGKGSRFVFKIPIDPRSDRRIEKNILVVDDEESICEMLKMNLTQAGHRVSVAKNGRQAIQRLQEKENPLDLVFLDLMLPMVSGVEVFKVIRQMVIKPEVVVITAYPNSDLLFQAMEFGPLTVIIKPFKMENILELVSRNVSSSDGSSLSGKTT